MTGVARPVYPTSTPGEKGVIAHFGVERPDYNRNRAVFYFVEAIHAQDTGQPHDETKFSWLEYEAYKEMRPDFGFVPDKTIVILHTLLPFAYRGFDKHIGIRLSSTNEPGYKSKIVIYLRRSADINDICVELAKMMYFKVHDLQVEDVYPDPENAMSEKEQDDRRWYGILD